MTWQIQFARASDFLIIAKLDINDIDHLEKYYTNIIDAFEGLNSSVFCSSVIYNINQNTSIKYHISNDDKIIRIIDIVTT